MIQPEMKAIQAKYKGNRAKISEEQMKLYRERGVNPASGCLPALLQMLLLLPMYQVFSQGLSAPNISSMLSVFGQPVITVQCYDPTNPLAPCIDPNVPWLSWLPQISSNGLEFYPGGLPANLPEIFIMVLPGLFGLSLLALVSALLQLVQTRMMTTPSDDPQQRSTQRVFLILPLFSLIYGWFLPAGLFIYWITTTIFSIVQQFLINGFGGLFPLFGWTPAFARSHRPRFPVPEFTPRPEPASTQPGSIRRSIRRVRQALDGRQRGWHHQAGEAQQPARETPMSEYQEFTGRTVEEAIRAAREAFGVAGLDDLDFEILTPGSRGVLGMGAEPARIIARRAIRAGRYRAQEGRPPRRSRCPRRASPRRRRDDRRDRRIEAPREPAVPADRDPRAVRAEARCSRWARTTTCRSALRVRSDRHGTTAGPVAAGPATVGPRRAPGHRPLAARGRGGRRARAPR